MGRHRSGFEKNDVDRQIVQASLRQLIERGYISQKQEWTNFHKLLKVLKVDWEKAIADGLWDPESN